jgi:hypothetical protein
MTAGVLLNPGEQFTSPSAFTHPVTVSKPVLWHIEISRYNEKVRWALVL